MSFNDFHRCSSRLFLLLISAYALTSYALSGGAQIPAELSASDSAEAISLRDQLVALSPTVRPREAQRVVDCAYRTSRKLARDYKVVGPPLFPNFLVNIGMKERGLCFQWAGDLFAQLNRLHLQTLALHWGAARAATWREHNCVVVTAKGQSFEDGVVLDAWRHSGNLFWSRVGADHYPWERRRSGTNSPNEKMAALRCRKTTLAFHNQLAARSGFYVLKFDRFSRKRYDEIPTPGPRERRRSFRHPHKRYSPY